MSSILKALKKLESGDFHHIREPETESAETSDFAHPRLRRTDIKKTIRQQAKVRQRLNRLVFVAAVLLIVFGLFLTQKQKLVSYSHTKDNAVAKKAAADSLQSVITEKQEIRSLLPERNLRIRNKIKLRVFSGKAGCRSKSRNAGICTVF